MKKFFYLSLLLACASLQAQISTLVINNYSSYYLYGRFGANGLSGNCFPAINAPVDGDHIVQPNTLNINYKFYNSNLAATPVNNWWVQTSLTSPGTIRSFNHVSLNPSGVLSTNTDWTFYWFQTKDSALLPYDDFTMGVTNACSASSNVTNQTGTYAEAEWFTIGNFTYVQIYDI